MRSLVAALAFLLLAPCALAQASPSRGQLLYDTHCIACHTTQVHWRDQRLASDWPTLKAQVRRFQGMAALQWSEDDVDAVTRYLNDSIYHFPSNQARR
jgi:mono/diheme cytochrome c family protein